MRTVTKDDTGRGGPTRLLTLLPAELAPALIAFSDHVAALEVDYIIFMARKAVRLHDLLIAAGARQPVATVVTDHILDQNLDHLAGKRCALVDDTLILGTTLAEAERKLRAAGVTHIEKVVFAIDRDNFARGLCKIDRSFVTLDESETLTFCAAEVEALSLAGIPYLTDFPFSERIRLTRAQLDTLYSQPKWDSYSLSTDMQEAEEVFYYTHLPNSESLSQMSELVGELWDIVEIAKVRSFVFTPEQRHYHLAHVIPIVTLQPLSEDRIEELFNSLLRELIEVDTRHVAALRKHLTGTKVRLRFLQYFLGLVVGEEFLEGLRGALGRDRPFCFDTAEAVRLFGPWLRPEIDALHLAAATLARGGRPPRLPSGSTQASTVPPAVQQVGLIDLRNLFGSETDANENEPRTLFSDLTRIFLELHRQYEIPARQEVRELGASIHDATPERTPRRNRLKMGITWGMMHDFLTSRAAIDAAIRPMQLSLMLDALIDLGVAVPILAECDGIYFRAYRHGEDALFAENEAALAYHIARGFLDGCGRDSIARLTFEKLLVALLRVGVSRKFLTPHYGLSGNRTVARIAFHRHGAIATLPEEPSIFADDQESWLSRYLVSTKVVRRKGEAYELGTEPNAGVMNNLARHEAHKVGLFIGMLNKERDGGAVLGQRNLTLLMTCPQPRDATAAVLAEYFIFDQWFALNGRRLGEVDFDSSKTCERLLHELLNSGGYNAFNSTRLKFCGYFSKKIQQILIDCKQHFLDGGGSGVIAAAEWEAIFGPLLARGNEDERAVFEIHLGHMGKQTLRMAVGMFSMELGLASALLAGGAMKRSDFERTCRKVSSYLEEVAAKLPHDGSDIALKNLRQRSQDLSPLPDPEEAYRFGLRTVQRSLKEGRAVAEEAAEEVRRYGRLTPSEHFKFALWFEFRAEPSKTRSDDQIAESLRRKLHFLAQINKEIGGLARDARRGSARITIAPSKLDTGNDERTLLFSGVRAREWLGTTVDAVLKIARESDVALHLMVVNADFAGHAPYSFYGNPAIEGQDFWCFGRELQGWIRQQSHHYTRRESVVWCAGTELDLMKRMSSFRWLGSPDNYHVPLEIGERRVDVRLLGGHGEFRQKGR